MQQQQQNRPAPLPLNPFAVMSTWMYADPVEGATKRPNLRFDVIRNVPRITVRTNVPNDLNYGRIEFNTDLATFAAAMAYGQRLARGEDVPQEQRYVYQDDFVAGKRLDNVMTLSTLIIGREKDSGRIYIAVISSQQQRPRIRFFFGPSKYHNILNGDGSPLSPKDLSESYALGFLESAYSLVKTLLVTGFDPEARNVANPAAIQQQGQNRGGNNNYQNRPQNQGSGNSGGGFSQPQSNSGFDDDIPEF